MSTPDTTTALAPIQAGELTITPRNAAAAQALSALPPEALAKVNEVVVKRNMVVAVLHQVMQSGVHYGVIPGTGKDAKPTLLKPGAELLAQMFQFDPKFEVVETVDGAHRTYLADCFLERDGVVVAGGAGSCSTWEKKYRWRGGGRVCPECGAATIKRSSFEDRNTGDKGWYCFEKIGGCNAKFHSEDRAITAQETKAVENPDLADQWNTVLKMARKRALVDAVLLGTAASEVFTQDLEDMPQATEMRNVTPAAAAPADPPAADPLKALLDELDATVRSAPFAQNQLSWIAKERDKRSGGADKQQAQANLQALVKLVKEQAAKLPKEPEVIQEDLQERLDLSMAWDCKATWKLERDKDLKVVTTDATAERFLQKWEGRMEQGAQERARPRQVASTEGLSDDMPEPTDETDEGFEEAGAAFDNATAWPATPFELKDQSRAQGKKVWGALVDCARAKMSGRTMVREGDPILVHPRKGKDIIKIVTAVLGHAPGQVGIIVEAEEESAATVGEVPDDDPGSHESELGFTPGDQ